MPPLIIWGVGVLGSAVLARWALKEARRINQELDDARLAQMAKATGGPPAKTLRRDPQTGAYRPQ